jgi:NAD(P)H-dependent FMN reductase
LEVATLAKPVLQVIIGSTRPGRVGPAVADWIVDRAREQGDFEVEVTDLAVLDLPIFDEPEHPRLRRYVHKHTKEWSAIVDRSDAFVFVIPEYNHSYNAATKNALDYLSQEWRGKPAGIVTYGGASGGVRAAQMLVPVLGALQMVTVAGSVNIRSIRERLDDAGRLEPDRGLEHAAASMLADLADAAAAVSVAAVSVAA